MSRTPPKTPAELADLFESKAAAADREAESAELVRMARCEGQAIAWRWAAEQARSLPGASDEFGDDVRAMFEFGEDDRRDRLLDMATEVKTLAESVREGIAAGRPFDTRTAQLLAAADRLDTARVARNLAEFAHSAPAPDRRGKPPRAPAGGPMFPERLAEVRADIAEHKHHWSAQATLEKLLADRDHWYGVAKQLVEIVLSYQVAVGEVTEGEAE